MNNQMVETSWVHPTQLDDRMDAKPFRNWIQKCTARIKGSGIPLSKLAHCTSYISRGVNGAIDEKTATKLLKTRHVKKGYIEIESAFLSDEKAMRLGTKKLRKGDVILTSSGLGTIGRAAHFSWPSKCTVDNHVTIIRLKKDIKSGFLMCFLNTEYGFALCEFGTTGSTGQLELSRDRIANFLIPCPHELIQEYIDDKIQMAEKCRLVAGDFSDKADSILSIELGEAPSQIVLRLHPEGLLKNGGFSVVVEPDLIRNRLDPIGYHPQLLSIQKSLHSQKTKYKPLRKLATLLTSERSRVNSSSSYFVSVLHVDNKGYLNRQAASKYYPESPGREAKAADILVSCINPAANRIAVCDDMKGSIACSPEFAILESKGLPPHYLSFVLRSDLVYRQMIHLGKGTSSSRRRIDEEELLDLEIPVVSGANHIATLEKKRQKLISRAFQLTAEAKSDVEALIEGKLDTNAILSGKLKAPTWEDIEKELEGI